jgi:hypothetical protein
METLEELKAIIAGKPEGASQIAKSAGQSRYLKHNKRRDFIYYDGKTFCSFPVGSGYLKTCKSIRSLSDIERIIELMECLKSIEQTVDGGDVLGCWDMMKIKDCLKWSTNHL